MSSLIDETEDHLFIENISRVISLLYFAIMFIVTYAIFYYFLPETDGEFKFISGSSDFPITYKDNLTIGDISNSAVVGLISSLLICLITEYFTS